MQDKTRLAKDIMTRRVHALSPTAPVEDATNTLLRLGFSGAPVTDEHGKLLGVFTEHDALRVLSQAVYHGWPSGTVADHMTSQVQTVAADADLATVAKTLTDGCLRRMIVVDGDVVVGVISRQDVLRAFDGLLTRDRPRTTYELIDERRG